MLRDDKKPAAREAVERMDSETFVYFIAELYARQGSDILVLDATQQRGYDIIAQNTRFTPKGETDLTAINCQKVTLDDVSYEFFENDLKPELREEFDYYVLCSTGESLTTLARQKLSGQGYSGDWFDFQNLNFISDRLMEPHSAYLPFVYEAVSPADYPGGWENNEYLRDRFEYLGVSVTDRLFPKIQAADETLLFIEHTEKFAIIESFGIPSSIYDHMQYEDYRPPEIMKELTRRVNIEETTPNDELFNRESFD